MVLLVLAYDLHVGPVVGQTHRLALNAELLQNNSTQLPSSDLRVIRQLGIGRLALCFGQSNDVSNGVFRDDVSARTAPANG